MEPVAIFVLSACLAPIIAAFALTATQAIFDSIRSKPRHIEVVMFITSMIIFGTISWVIITAINKLFMLI